MFLSLYFVIRNAKKISVTNRIMIYYFYLAQHQQLPLTAEKRHERKRATSSFPFSSCRCSGSATSPVPGSEASPAPRGWCYYPRAASLKSRFFWRKKPSLPSKRQPAEETQRARSPAPGTAPTHPALGNLWEQVTGSAHRGAARASPAASGQRAAKLWVPRFLRPVPRFSHARPSGAAPSARTALGGPTHLARLSPRLPAAASTRPPPRAARPERGGAARYL